MAQVSTKVFIESRNQNDKIYYVAQRIPLLVKWCMVVAMMDAVVFVWPKLDCLSDTSQILILHWSPPAFPCALSPSVCQCENHRKGEEEPIPHLQVTTDQSSVLCWTRDISNKTRIQIKWAEISCNYLNATLRHKTKEEFFIAQLASSKWDENWN